MLALVKFITLTDEQSAEINANGWSCPVGIAYLEATQKVNPVLALAMGLYTDAARIAGDENFIFRALQNVDTNWRDLNPNSIICLTNRPRSMMVGDLIVFDDGRCLICARYGWTNLTKFKEEGTENESETLDSF